MNTFLPPDYQEPSSGSTYLKFKEDGEYRFRFLSSPITGWLCWKDRKPLRFRTLDEVPPGPWDVNQKTGETQEPTFFWTAVVWDYSDAKIKILEITQKTIRKPILGLIEDPDWGNPKEYDLKVVRTKVGDKVEYTVRPGKLAPLDSDIAAQYEFCKINLEALYDDKDPFQSA